MVLKNYATHSYYLCRYWTTYFVYQPVKISVQKTSRVDYLFVFDPNFGTLQ